MSPLGRYATPFSTISFQTPLSVEEAWSAVRRLQSREWFVTFGRSQFTLERVAADRSPLVACLVGKIRPEGTGSCVRLRLALPPFTRFGLVCWILMSCVFAVNAVGNGRVGPHLFLLLVPVFAALAVWRRLRQDGRRAERHLRRALERVEESPAPRQSPYR